MNTTMPARLFRRAEAARYLKDQHNLSRTPATLASLACTGGGPRFLKIGNVPYYSGAELDAWVASISTAIKSSTSDPGDRADADALNVKSDVQSSRRALR